MTRRIWITGALGFSGRHLASWLRQLPNAIEVIGLDCREPAPDRKLALDRFYVADLADRSKLEEIAVSHPPDRVYHLAGLLPPANEGDLWRVNVGGTQTLLQALAAGRKRPRVLTIGSAAEYLPSSSKLRESDRCGGASPYGRTKWAQSIVALACGREFGGGVLVARTFNLLGPGLGKGLVAGALCSQFAEKSKEPIRVGNTTSRRDFLDIRDAVRAYWTIMERGVAGRIYNVCSGRSLSVWQLVELFERLSKSERRVERDESLLKKADIDRVVGDNSRLRALGWKRRFSLRTSLQDMLEDAASNK